MRWRHFLWQLNRLGGNIIESKPVLHVTFLGIILVFGTCLIVLAVVRYAENWHGISTLHLAVLEFCITVGTPEPSRWATFD